MQTKQQTFIEVTTGLIIGLLGSATITYLCLINLDQLTAFWMTVTTTTLCTIWSLVRGHTIRRIFNNLLTSKGVDMVPKELIELYSSDNQQLINALSVRSADVFTHPSTAISAYSVDIGASISVIDEIVKLKMVSNLPINDTTFSGLKTLKNLGLSGPVSPDKVIIYKNCHFSGVRKDNEFVQTQLLVFCPDLMHMLDRYKQPGVSGGGTSTWVNVAHTCNEFGSALRILNILRGLDDEDTETVSLEDAINIMQMPKDHGEILTKAAEILINKRLEKQNG